jgi:hypothetical protein
MHRNCISGQRAETFRQLRQPLRRAQILTRPLDVRGELAGRRSPRRRRRAPSPPSR